MEGRLNWNTSEDKKYTLIELVRICLFLLVLAVCIGSYLFQTQFINLKLLSSFYVLMSISFFVHLVVVSRLETFFSNSKWLFGTFVIDSILISSLIYFSGQNQSLYLFLHIINILLAGFVFQSRGALVLALLTCISFTVACLLGPEMKILSYFSMLILNNMAFVFTGAVSGYLADQWLLTEKKLFETDLSLKSLEQLNKIIVEQAPLGIITFDSAGAILQANAKAESILEGYLKGQNLFQILPKLKSVSLDITMVHQIIMGSSALKEEKSLSIHTSPFFHPQLKQKMLVMLIDDRTEFVKMEEVLRQKEKLAAVGQLAAGIAHEIRNPLAGISGSIELLNQNANSEEEKKLMSIVLREIDRLNNLITEFLDYSRPDQRPTTKVNLSLLVEEILNSLQYDKHLLKDIQLAKSIASDMWILGFSEKLKQALLNIIINGCQAMGDSNNKMLSVELTASDKNKIIIKIRDTGSGMTSEVKTKIFEPFFTTKSKGTGLGLALTHKIIETHRGLIYVNSEIGVGTEFVIELPNETEDVASGQS